MEIRKLPFFRPTTSNLPRFSAPPLLELRAGLPMESSAISGARFRASSPTLASVPRTRTVSARCSPGFSGEESASSSSPTSVMENGGDCRFAQETSTAALPGFWSERLPPPRCLVSGPAEVTRPAPPAKTPARMPIARRSSLDWRPRHHRNSSQESQSGPSTKPLAARRILPAKSTRPHWVREWTWQPAQCVPLSNQKSCLD